MQAMEYSRTEPDGTKAYALALVIVTNAENPIQSQMRHFKEAVMGYIADRGAECKDVMLTVMTAPEEHEGGRQFVNMVITQEAELSPLFETRGFSLEFGE